MKKTILPLSLIVLLCNKPVVDSA